MKNRHAHSFRLQPIIRQFSRLAIIPILLASALPTFSKPAKATFDAVDRIVALGDIHGDYDRMIEILELADVIDSKGKWIGKNTHLVQLGDIPDRGPKTRQAIDFLKKLEKSARRKKGRVHTLIGNHDAMNVYGDLRYVTEAEFKAFAAKTSILLLEKLYQDEIEWIKDNNPEEKWPTFDETFKEAWFKGKPPGYLEHRWSWLPDGDIGKWVLDRNAILKIGDNLFLHGGIGPNYANWTIDALNAAVREHLAKPDEVEGTILLDEQGPLWYRGLAMHDEEQESDHLESLLRNFGVKRIIIGHTPTTGIILPRFDGKVILADVGLCRYYGDNLACLIIEGDVLTAIHRDGSIRVPDDTRQQSLLEYLQSLAKLEPNNSTIKKRIQALLAK